MGIKAIIHSDKIVVLISQSFTSALNFWMIYYIAQNFGVAIAGEFGLAFIIAVNMGSIINAALLQPAVSIASKQNPVRQNKTFAVVFFAQLMVCAILTVISVGAFIILLYYGIPVQFYVLTLSLCLTLITYEAVRRQNFMTNISGLSIVSDIGKVVIVSAGFIVAGKIENNNADSLIGIYAASNLFSSVVYMALNGRYLSLSPAYFVVMLRRLFRSGKHLVLFSSLQFVNGNLFVVMAGILLSAYDVGIVRICQSIIGLSNPIIQSMENIIPKWIGEKIKRIGPDAAFAAYRKLFAVVTIMFAVGYTLLLTAGEKILSLFSLGDSHVAIYVLSLLCVVYLVEIVSSLLIFRYRSQEKVGNIVFGAIAGSIVSILMAYPLIISFGPIGVAGGIALSRGVSITTLALVAKRFGRSG